MSLFMLAIYLLLTAVNVPGGVGMTGTQVNNADHNYTVNGTLPTVENVNRVEPVRRAVRAGRSKGY